VGEGLDKLASDLVLGQQHGDGERLGSGSHSVWSLMDARLPIADSDSEILLPPAGWSFASSTGLVIPQGGSIR